MTRIFLAFSILILSFGMANAQVDAISKYFDQYMEDDDFTVVFVSPKMFQLLGKLDTSGLNDREAEDVLGVIKDLRGLRVLTTEKNANSFYKEAMNKINTKEYETLMTVRSKGDNVRFLVKDSGDVIDELLLLVGGDTFTMISFVGKIDLNKISKLSKSLDIKGMEHLDELEEKN